MNSRHGPVHVPRKALCPVCRTAVYSPGGIHPQCALSRAEPPKLDVNQREEPNPIEWLAVEATFGTGDDVRPAAIAVAEFIGVPVPMIRLWIGTGAWPLPRSVRGTTLLFDLPDVECWLRTGSWPAGVHFRNRRRHPVR
jgi:hypothetical protein